MIWQMMMAIIVHKWAAEDREGWRNRERCQKPANNDDQSKVHSFGCSRDSVGPKL